MPDNGTPVDLDWDNRVLCSDESCIGTIGPDGHCKECGKPYAGETPFSRLEIRGASTAPSPEVSECQDPEGDNGATPETKATAESLDEDWEYRTLCSDEACIGVVGPDGRCKECGRLVDT